MNSTPLLAPTVAAGDKAAVDPVRAKAIGAAEQFEGFFIGQMLKGMRASTRELAGPDSVFKDPVNSDMQDLTDSMMAGKMAGQHAFGIADVILRQLLPTAATPTTTPTATPVATPRSPPADDPVRRRDAAR